MNGPRVLVVDDERQILRALELKLRNAGYTVDTAATALWVLGYPMPPGVIGKPVREAFESE